MRKIGNGRTNRTKPEPYESMNSDCFIKQHKIVIKFHFRCVSTLNSLASIHFDLGNFFNVVYVCHSIFRVLKRYHSHSTRIKSPPSNRSYRIFHRWMPPKRQRRFSHRIYRRIYWCWKSKRVQSTSNLASSTWKLAKHVTMKCWVTVGFVLISSQLELRAIGTFFHNELSRSENLLSGNQFDC